MPLDNAQLILKKSQKADGESVEKDVSVHWNLDGRAQSHGRQVIIQSDAFDGTSNDELSPGNGGGDALPQAIQDTSKKEVSQKIASDGVSHRQKDSCKSERSGAVEVKKHFRSLPGGGEIAEVAEEVVRRAAQKANDRYVLGQGDHKYSPQGEADLKNRKNDFGARLIEPDNELNYGSQDDDDVFIPATVDFERRSERAKERCANEIERLCREDSLRNAAMSADTYSFKWFKSLIELESQFDDMEDVRREFAIRFGSVRLEAGTLRTLVLDQPDRIIPPSVEDLSNIPLTLVLSDRTTNVEIEVASVRSYSLLVKLKDGAEITGIDLSRVEEARIEVRNPTFLLDELRRRFKELSLKDDFNMRDNLPENMEFIFGPPGTGKTTHLAKSVLLPMMRGGIRTCVCLCSLQQTKPRMF